MLDYYYDYVREQLFFDLQKFKAVKDYEDIKQELYIRYIAEIEKIDRFKVTNYPNYYKKVCYNLTADIVKENIKQEKKEKKALKEYFDMSTKEKYDFHFSEVQNVLTAARLTDLEHATIACYKTGLSYAAIAEVIKTTPKAVKQSFYRGQNKVLKVIDND